VVVVSTLKGIRQRKYINVLSSLNLKIFQVLSITTDGATNTKDKNIGLQAIIINEMK